MNVMRPSHWLESNAFPGDFNRALERWFGTGDSDQSDVVTSEWAPRVDIREEAKRFVMEADIPGVDPKDIEVNMDKGVLSIRGERKSEVKEDNGKYSRVERTRGTFHRRFALPDSADASGIRASGKNGVLEIEIPKRPETTPRRISIEVQ